MLESLLKYQFLQNAVAAALLASISCGIIGTLIIEKKLIMMSGGIAHTSYGGVGLGYLLGFEPLLGAFVFSILSAFSIGFLKRKGGVRTDVVIGLLWALGMALGIFFIALTPGYPPDLTSYLFGNILSITKSDLLLIFLITVFVAATVVLFFNHWKAFLFDDEFAAILGVKTVFLHYFLLILIAITIVALIRVVGIILALSLLCAPAASAGLLSVKLKNRMIISIFLGFFFCFSGLWLSYEINFPSGAAIVMFSVSCYIILYIFRAISAKSKRKKLISGKVGAVNEP